MLLWALPLALLPVILHFFFRRNPKKQQFSDFRFIYLAIEKLQKSFRIRQYLLLLTRTLILALLILFFSRPMVQFSSGGKPQSQENTAAIVIAIDSSYSMDYRQDAKARFERFKQNARKIVSLLPARDRIGIVSYSNRIEAATPSLSNDKAYLNKLIDDLKISNRTTDLSIAWPVINQLFSQFSQSNRSVVILSDLAKHGFEKPLPQSGETIKVFYFEPQESENYWVGEAKAEYLSALKQWNIESAFNFNAKKYPFSWPVFYYVDKKKVGSDIVEVLNTNKVNRSFSYQEDNNSLAVEIKLEKDNLDIDNVLYLALNRSSSFKTWIIDGDPKFGGVTSESFYLRTVFPEAQIVTEDKVDSLNLTAPGVIILANLRKDHDNIGKFIASGGGAMVFLGKHTSDEFNPQYLPANIGTKFNSVQGITWSAKGHPINKLITLDEFELKNVQVSEGFILQAHEGARVLSVLSSGWPYLLEAGYGNGKVIMSASSAGRDWTNIVGKAVFAPLVRNMVAYLSGREDESALSSIKIGEVFRYATKLNDLMVVAPDAKRYKPVKNGNEIIFYETEEPGIYTVLSGDRQIYEFAVNLDKASESDLTPASDPDLKKYFMKNYLIKLSLNWENDFMSMISGKDMTRYILFVIFLLIIAEVLLANPVSKKKSAVGDK
jgi:hypothetical protein